MDQRWHVDDGGDDDQQQPEHGRLVKSAQRNAVDRIDQVGRDPVEQARSQVERQQHPHEPDRPARPRPDGDRLPPERSEGQLGIVPQRDRVIGDRDDREGRDHERQPEPQQAVAQENLWRLARDAGPREQSRQEEEHRHEEAVGAEHDDVEADPGRRVGVTEIGVGNDRVVQQHHQREEGAGPIERQIARLGFRRGVRLCADRRGM
jgi:hypothetical protein